VTEFALEVGEKRKQKEDQPRHGAANQEEGAETSEGSHRRASPARANRGGAAQRKKLKVGGGKLTAGRKV